MAGLAVITEACIGVKDRACVDVCPVDCIYESEDQLYIHPDECIDCGACIPVCPVRAIYEVKNLPPDKHHWIAINAERSAALPLIAEKAQPLPGALERKRQLGF